MWSVYIMVGEHTDTENSSKRRTERGPFLRPVRLSLQLVTVLLPPFVRPGPPRRRSGPLARTMTTRRDRSHFCPMNGLTSSVQLEHTWRELWDEMRGSVSKDSSEHRSVVFSFTCESFAKNMTINWEAIATVQNENVNVSVSIHTGDYRMPLPRL